MPPAPSSHQLLHWVRLNSLHSLRHNEEVQERKGLWASQSHWWLYGFVNCFCCSESAEEHWGKMQPWGTRHLPGCVTVSVCRNTKFYLFMYSFTRHNIMPPSLKERGLKLFHLNTGQGDAGFPPTCPPWQVSTSVAGRCWVLSVPMAMGHMPGSSQHGTWEGRARAQVFLLQMLSETEEHPGLWEKYLVYSELLPLKGDLTLSPHYGWWIVSLT